MQIVDAEYQWSVFFFFLLSPLDYIVFITDLMSTHFNRDRRKLTFYFKADKRVDFRDLTKENFRIFKSRIWMSMVSKDGEYPMFYTLFRQCYGAFG